MLVGIVPNTAPAADAIAASPQGAAGANAFEQALAASVDQPATAPAATGLDARLAKLLAAQAHWLTAPASVTATPDDGTAATGGRAGAERADDTARSDSPDAAQITAQDAATAAQMAMGVLLPFPMPLAPVPAEPAPVPGAPSPAGSPGGAQGSGLASGQLLPDGPGAQSAGARTAAAGSVVSGAAGDVPSDAVADSAGNAGGGAVGDAARDAGNAETGSARDGARNATELAGGVRQPAAGRSTADATANRAASTSAAASSITAESSGDLRESARETSREQGSARPDGAAVGTMTVPALDNRRSIRGQDMAMSAAAQRLARALGNSVQVTGMDNTPASDGQAPAVEAAAAAALAAAGQPVVNQTAPDAATGEASAGTVPVTATSPHASADGEGTADRQSRESVQPDLPAGARAASEPATSTAQAFIIPPAVAGSGTVAAATAAAPVQAPAQVPDPESTAALVDTIRLFAKPGVWEATVTLKPEHMGEVTINLSVERNNVIAVVHAESAGVREWLHSNEGNVRTGLNEQGLNLSRFDVEEQQPERRRDDQQPRQQQPQQDPRRKSARRGDTAERFEITV